MRKFLFVVLVIVFSLTGARAGLSAEYQLKIAIDKESKEVKGEETVSFINEAKEGIEEVYFYLYPQVFEGRIRVEEVKTEGRWLSHTVEEGQKCIYLKADKVRDFALVMSPEYKSITGRLENKEKTDEDEGEEKSYVPEI